MNQAKGPRPGETVHVVESNGLPEGYVPPSASMVTTNFREDPEIQAMYAITASFTTIPAEARVRVLRWALARYTDEGGSAA